MSNNIPVEPLKLIFVIIFFIVSIASNWAALAYIHDYVKLKPLQDVSYVISQNMTIALLGDIIGGFLSFTMLFICLLHQHNTVVIQRVFYVSAWLYAMRAITISLTHIPPAYVDDRIRCQLQVKNSSFRSFDLYFDRWLTLAKGFGTQDIEKPMLCGDLLFSGHTLAMVISAMTIRYYIPKRIKHLRYVTSGLALIGMFCMVLSRAHYSADVLIAYWLATFGFSIYHAYVETLPYIRDDSTASKLWMIKIGSWLEDRVDNDEFENKLKIPFIEYYF